MKTVLVTGGAGYIGSHASFYLQEKGCRVIILDKFLHDQFFPQNIGTVFRGDIADKDLLSYIFSRYKIDAVMHFAANIEVGESVKKPARFYDNNVSKTLVLLDAMIKYDVKNFIFSSSCAVYGIPAETPITENCPLNPISPYGKTKYFIETVLSDYDVAYGLKSVCLRYFNAAGGMPELGLYEQHKPETHLIPLLVDAAFTGKEFKIFGNDYPTPDGTCIRDFLHVLDIARAHYLSMEYLIEGGWSEMFNLGSEKGFSVMEVLKYVEAETGFKIAFKIEPRRQGDPAILVADSTKIRKLLGWIPAQSAIEDIINLQKITTGVSFNSLNPDLPT